MTHFMSIAGIRAGRRAVQAALLALASVLLAGCASAPQTPDLAAPSALVRTVPVVLPDPAARPGALLLAQRIHAETDSDVPAAVPKTADFEAYLHAGGGVFRMALMHAGLTVWTLALEDGRLAQERRPGLPAALRGEHLLRDVALAYWPAAYLSQALPGLRIEAGPTMRRLLDAEGHTMFVVRYEEGASAEDPQGRTRIENLFEGYRLVIDSRAM